MDHNLLFVLLLPLIFAWLGYLLWSRWTGKTLFTPERRARNGRLIFISVGTLIVVFTVARNLPFVPYIGSGIS